MSDRRGVALRWSGRGDLFHGRGAADLEIPLDGDSEEGVSPTEALLLSLAGCMGVDVRMILEKSRVPLETLEVEVEGERAPEPPRRFTRIRLAYRVRGPGEEDEAKLERAVALSRDKYCSVLHTLREDLEIEIAIERV